MVRFLITRPVAVLMTFISVIMLGIISSSRLPVSLMPDVDIPEITVAVSRPDVSAREMENTVVSILRRNLLQVPGLADLRSESHNGSALIRLSFKYGININLAFMEVNEKIDGAMNNLPRDIQRPSVIKASASDIPVFMVNITLSEGYESSEKFTELSNFAETIIKKRIEQLPEVAMADITGQVKRELYILPDRKKMMSLGITEQDIIKAVELNNLNIGNIMVRDGKYLLNLEFNSYLKDPEDVKNIYLNAGSARILQLKDIADVGIREEKPRGLYYSNGKRAVVLAIIKEASAQMETLKSKMGELLTQFRKDYPQMDFEISQDQTLLLDYSISNLRQSLWAGGLLAFFVMFFFLKDAKSPLIIGFSIPATLVISLLFFYLTGLTINVISLAGLILGIGMMIDNSIVIIENITQWIDRGESLLNACIKGTNEVITPLISSVLTTCAVFIPLIFLSGIAGALFYDQAIAIVIGQGVSLIVGITLLPTLYYLIYKRRREGLLAVLVKKVNIKGIEKSYEGGMDFFFRKRKMILVSFFLFIALMIWLFIAMKKERFPAVRQDEFVVTIDWNENIDTGENLERCLRIINSSSDLIKQTNSFIGEQQFLFNRDYDLSYTQSKIYIKATGYDAIQEIKNNISNFIVSNYPDAVVETAPQQNIFEKIFSASKVPLVAEVTLLKEKTIPSPEKLVESVNRLKLLLHDKEISVPPFEDKIMLRLDPIRLILYNIDPDIVYTTLRTALNRSHIGELRSSGEILPVVLAGRERLINDIISSEFVPTRNASLVPLKELVEIQRIHDYKFITGGMHGEYIPINIFANTRSPGLLMSEIRSVITSDSSLDVQFSGGLLEGQRLFREMAVILVISVLLLYFILAAQFESLSQPFIVMLELPIDIAGALLLVKLAGGTINIITMIGLIVMSGVIINDSILKVDTINNLRREGMGLLEAIYTGGARRLKPIIMVALAALVSTFPMLVAGGLGSELQRPMALALIGGMSLGTVVSLFFIPLAYWYIYRNLERKY
ncbi:MAG TPA: efflux RND transporter permease subunit [Bacteroidales bacterium]|mgnify:FL=1|nr:efflux RND transporter permease subunit [Bacteroidales bacterium]HOK74321.1 efflux RND transporter permease subunit [Bacteroidales bacterium]HPP92785.1 efflux RND transporter permease subunit [Bacteroidales bacterium]HQG56189.1 efflux RND transporter permease subunit [Bacteroidales bacterium]HQK70403.1 efflux RND transporter permease subunit [Bacteroidales bacterium]